MEKSKSHNVIVFKKFKINDIFMRIEFYFQQFFIINECDIIVDKFMLFTHTKIIF